MARKRFTAESIIGMLRDAEVRLGQGQTIGVICKHLGISEQSYYRWRREYGGLKLDQARRMKDLERENERLRKAVSDLTLDKLILKEALEGKLLTPFPPPGLRRSCALRDGDLGTPRLCCSRPAACDAAPASRHPR